MTFTYYCRQIKPTGLQGSDKDCRILRVTDGTECKVNMKSFNDASSSEADAGDDGGNTQFLCREGLTDVDVFIHGKDNIGRVFNRVREESYVLLKGVRLLREDLQAGSIYCVMHCLAMEDGFDCSYVELPLGHPAAIATRKNVMTAREMGTQPDAFIDQLFEVSRLCSFPFYFQRGYKHLI